MKRSVVIMTVIFVSVSRLSAGENESKTAIFVNFGMSGALAPDEFDKTNSPGLNWGCEFGYRISPLIIPALYFHLSRFDLNGPGSRFFGDLTSYSYGLNVRLYPSRKTREPRPYLAAGLGYTRFGGFAHYSTGPAHPVDFTDWAGDETAETVAVAGGLEFYLSKTGSLFVDVGYRMVFADNERISFLPIRIGLGFY